MLFGLSQYKLCILLAGLYQYRLRHVGCANIGYVMLAVMYQYRLGNFRLYPHRLSNVGWLVPI